MGAYWDVRAVERGIVELVSGHYLATFHAPDSRHTGGFTAIEKQWEKGALRSLHTGPTDRLMQDTTSQRLPGQLARSVRAQWSDSGLSALVHAVHGVHSAWCRAGCPIGALVQTAQGTVQAG